MTGHVIVFQEEFRWFKFCLRLHWISYRFINQKSSRYFSTFREYDGLISSMTHFVWVILNDGQIKPLIDNEVPNITDVPYEAAIAAFGALFAGIFGLFASYCRKSRLIRIIYAFLSLRKSKQFFTKWKNGTGHVTCLFSCISLLRLLFCQDHNNLRNDFERIFKHYVMQHDSCFTWSIT